MPEEIEVPTEHLHEHMEHAAPAAHAAPGAQWVSWVALLPMAFAS